jgi:hypothetical protein
MITLLMRVITVIAFSSQLATTQRWVAARGYGVVLTPQAEPEPPARVFPLQLPPRYSNYGTLRVAFPDPVPEPMPEPMPEPSPARRVSRRIMNTQILASSTIAKSSLAKISSPAPEPATKTESYNNDTVFSYSVKTEKTLVDKIFADTPKERTWAIDTDKFHILPAVPAISSSKTVRIPKEVSDDEKSDNDKNKKIPEEFSPVPAVPNITTSPLPREPKSSLGQAEPPHCLTKCVHLFCAEQGPLTSEGICQEKCAAFCS